MPYETRFFTTQSNLYAKALALRYDILRQPLGLQFTPEELAKDHHDTHLALLNENEELVACLTITQDGSDKLKVRQVAVKESLQGKGLGSKLNEAVEQYARQNNIQTLYCHARKTAVPFYQKLGYQVTSEEFTEVTIPHYRMEKKLL